MQRVLRVLAASVAGVVLSGTAVCQAAIVMSRSPSAPTPDAYDQSNVSPGSPIDTGLYLDHANVYGQTFTTPTGGPFQLDTVSVQTGNGGSSPVGWSIQINAVTGTSPSLVLTPVVTGTTLALSGYTDFDWVTFSFSPGSATLSPSTLYSFSLYNDAGAKPLYKKYSGDSFLTGDFMRMNGAARTFVSTGQTPSPNNEDLVFNVGLSPVPEPTSLALLALGGLALLRRQRKP